MPLISPLLLNRTVRELVVPWSIARIYFSLINNYTNKVLNNQAPSRPPKNGPTTGTQLYDQSEETLPGIGSRKCAMRGARSLAGLIAKPVVPPRLNPIETINPPTT